MSPAQINHWVELTWEHRMDDSRAIELANWLLLVRIGGKE